ncbi:MAG: hypothetical protein ACNI27_08765 [Desulfovibrio sp.]
MEIFMFLVILAAIIAIFLFVGIALGFLILAVIVGMIGMFIGKWLFGDAGASAGIWAGLASLFIVPLVMSYFDD